MVSKSIVNHKSASNIGANIATDSVNRIDRYHYLYRNDVYLYRREGIRGFLYESARLTDHSLRVIFKAKNNKLKRLRMIFVGTKDGLSFRPQIEYITNRKY